MTSQAAEKLNFSESAKNGSHQNAVGTIREAWLMDFYPSKSALSPFIRSFSAACETPASLRIPVSLRIDASFRIEFFRSP
jgi:hypothetical protein